VEDGDGLDTVQLGAVGCCVLVSAYGAAWCMRVKHGLNVIPVRFHTGQGPVLRFLEGGREIWRRRIMYRADAAAIPAQCAQDRGQRVRAPSQAHRVRLPGALAGPLGAHEAPGGREQAGRAKRSTTQNRARRPSAPPHPASTRRIAAAALQPSTLQPASCASLPSAVQHRNRACVCV
jgi:hypothetical protein